jgi:hypothetical protein
VTYEFQTTVGADEQSAFFIELPTEIVQSLGGGKRPPVRLTLNGFPHRTTVSVYSGRYYVPVRREIRQAAQLAPGDPVKVTVEMDREPRIVEVPPDLAEALAVDGDAAATFDRLSYSHRKEYVDWIEGAKRLETRRRRVASTMERLRAGRKEP